MSPDLHEALSSALNGLEVLLLTAMGLAGRVAYLRLRDWSEQLGADTRPPPSRRRATRRRIRTEAGGVKVGPPPIPSKPADVENEK
jgi:hypothetical protein